MRYISTAIVYPNSRVHVGFGWECVGADWLVRGLTAFGHDTYFSTGVDEHSLKVQKAAESIGKSPKAYCDQMADDISKVLDLIGISYDRFIRTSDEDHQRVVEALVNRAEAAGDIYQAKYEGHYCDGCEAYYTDKDLIDGLCAVHKKKTRWLSEENYFFKLSKYQDKLLKIFKENKKFLQPESRRNEVLNFIRDGLNDFSISRSSFTWGIPLPMDPKQVIYVWFDALINYLTAAGIEEWLKNPQAKNFSERWPADCHIIGKDITRFHTVYWPAMLMSLGIELPKRVFAHGFISLQGERMSSSTGNFVTPDEVVEFTGPDPFRYFLLAENSFGGDGKFSTEAVRIKSNSDLANDWGNLVNRSISMTRKYFPDEALSASTVPSEDSLLVKKSFENLLVELETSLEELDTAGYVKSCRERTRMLNLYIDKMKPWSIAKEISKDENAKVLLREVLFNLLEGIRWTATAFLPVLPFGMPEVFKQLGLEAPVESDKNLSNVPPKGPARPKKSSLKSLKWGEFAFQPEKPSPVYPRLEAKE